MHNDSHLHARHASVARSNTFARARRALGLERKKVLDIGCGYGEYLAFFGPGSIGITTTPAEVEFGTANGLDIREANAEEISSIGLSSDFEAAWANNLFEHMVSPHAFLIHLKGVMRPSGTLILGVPVVPVLPMLLRLRKWRGALASNHINFFTARTLRYTIERAGWKVVDVRPFLFSNRTLDRLCMPFMPHAYVIAYNDPDFRYPSKKLQEWEGQEYYEPLLRATEAS